MNREVVLVAGHGEMGGGEVMLLACADVLAAEGFAPVVVAPEYPSHLTMSARSRGHRVVEVAAHPDGSWARTAGPTRRAVQRLRREAPEAPVWCHGLRPIVATAGMHRRIAHVHRVPTPVQLPLLAAASAGADALVVPSAATRTFLPPRLARRARVLWNWTDDVAPPAPGGGVPAGAGTAADSAPVVGFLGRIAPEKGIADLVRALELLDEQGVAPRPLVRVGGEALFVSSDQAAELERLLDRLAGRLQRDGWVRRQDFLDRVDLLVCPSRVPESFGLVAAEAMAAGVPLVVSDAGALPEVVGHGHPHIASAGDPVSLACVLHGALGNLGTEAGDRAVARARRRWETHWSPAAGHDRVVGLLRDLGIEP